MMMMNIIIQQKTINTTTTVIIKGILRTINRILRTQETIDGDHIGCLKVLDLGDWMKKIICYINVCFFLVLRKLDGNGAVEETRMSNVT